MSSFSSCNKECLLPCHLPIRSLMVSEPWLCSLLSVSSAACRLMHSFSRLSLLRSSRQHLSCSSRTLASSCCSCLLLSVWVLRSLVAASVSARSNVFASSSWTWWKSVTKKVLFFFSFSFFFLQLWVPLEKDFIYECVTCFCKWMFFSFEMWEFWFLFFKSSNWSRRPLTAKQLPEQLQTFKNIRSDRVINNVHISYNIYKYIKYNKKNKIKPD